MRSLAVSEETLSEIGAVLRSGGLAIFPTETLVGLGCRAADDAAVARVVALKGRPEGKGLPLIAADEEQVIAACGPLPEAAKRLARRFWPGPLTLVLRVASRDRCAALAMVDGTVAIRIPGDAGARSLALAAGSPMVATSANRSGSPPVARVADVDPAIMAGVDLVVPGECPGGPPSTIVEAWTDHPRILRSGAVTDDRVREALVG
ncbi:MAG: L-threonylcarbamoyladenylate synthase [Acidobacteriota bacterium]